ncbi:HNH endonuclease [Massilia pseudoviolaceinigra]|uniref:HNH endonuclease n=1 Tax=Massilia pseudoviolaceinigra TaxID=3057165 RepID=UPI002796744A|nr:HNH endonuclease [Massilia sp. CCM 9206]MDQ1924222.1 HNH endonuclease [Massilia sp. CCM 9206]
MPVSFPPEASTTSTDWTDDELAAAVRAYVAMLRSELVGEPINKAEVNRQLREGALAGRTKSAVEFRMQNISSTLFDLRLPHIIGYRPARNVGSSVKLRIEQMLEANGLETLTIYQHTADERELAHKVTALLRQPGGGMPAGTAAPAQVMTHTLRYVRDPAVKAWVLKLAGGICEGCDMPAPFTGTDGFPYLEVHHVMPLASHGSDKPSNTAALCPNCHRRCHLSLDRDEFRLALYEKIDRLVLEVPEPVPHDTAVYIDDAGDT